MARKKSAASKATSSEGSARKPKGKVEQSDVDFLARRTLDLWRDQMMAIAQSPKAVREYSKVMEPVLNLFTQSLDMWLMMFEQFGKGMPEQSWASAFTAGKNERRTETKTAPTDAKAPAKGKKPRRKKTASRAKAAAAVSRRGDATVAELAKRVAHLKERGKRASGAATASRVAGTSGNVTELSVARQKRRRKA
jgi:hypothetical protein